MSQNFNENTTAEEAAAFWANEIKGKTVLVTGATWGGLGAEAARVIAKHEAKLVIVAGRRDEPLEETIQKIKAETPKAQLRPLLLDLASLASVRKAAQVVNDYAEPIDVLINNAGIMATPYFKTQDGFEGQLGTNHFGPFLFTNLILHKLLESPSPRIVNVSSSMHRVCPILFEDPSFADGQKYNKWQAYGQAKTANILFALELSKRYRNQGLTAFSLHPGGIFTNLQRDVDLAAEGAAGEWVDYHGNPLIPEGKVLTWKSIGAGTSTHIVAAFDPSIKEKSGSYLEDCQISNQVAMPYALDHENAAKLWSLSEKAVGQVFSS
ncbi:hypothetical protein Unana1_02025 [Umbelopsis nana]